MNERNWEYKWLQLSNDTNIYNFQVDNVSNEVIYEWKIFSNENADWIYSSNITTGARYFDFTGRIYGTKSERELAYKKLKEIIRSEDFPSLYNRWFYTLKWTDKRWIASKIQAKVYKPLKTEEIAHNMLSFTFTLLADNPLYTSQSEETITWWLGIIGWNTLPNVLPNVLNEGNWAITITNKWDKKASMYIQILWNLTNPRITNITNGQSLKILTNTTILVVDNRMKPFIVTENAVNIKSYKRWEFLYLSPWENKIVITSENYTEINDIDVLIKYNDTYE